MKAVRSVNGQSQRLGGAAGAEGLKRGHGEAGSEQKELPGRACVGSQAIESKLNLKIIPSTEGKKVELQGVPVGVMGKIKWLFPSYNPAFLKRNKKMC